MAKDKIIVISTHILEEVDAVCTRAVIIAQGRVVADCTPHELEARSRYYNAVSLVMKAPRVEQVKASIEKLPNVAAVEALKGEDNMVCLIAFPRDGKPIIGDISQFSRSADLGIEEVRVERGRLDDVFRAITSAGA
jgi:ABC-2 type transport system ATP-binding protein